MSVKSIIDISVNDSDFKRFSDYYDKYQAALGKQAQMWQKTGSSTVAISNQFQKMTAQLMAQNAARRGVEDDSRKQLTTLTQSDRLWTSMAKTTKGVAGNIKDATLSLMRWAGIVELVTGVLGVGGLFGISRMASGVAGMRQTAMGRGVSIGEQTAMKNFSQLGIDESFLDQVAQIKSDPSKQRSLAMFGIGNQMSTADTTVALLKAMRSRAQTSNGQYGLLDQQTGLSVGSNVWRSLATMGEKEFQGHVSAYQADRNQLNIGNKTAEGWANFNRAMQRAGETLERTFVNGLTKLEQPLTNLSGSFNNLVATILGSNGVQEGIGKLGEWIDQFAGTIKDGTFQQSVLDFIAGVADMAKTLKAWAHPIDTVGSKLSNPVSESLGKFFYGKKSHNSTDYGDVLADVDRLYGLPAGFMEAEFLKRGGKYGKNPFGMSEQFARDNNFNTDEPDEEAFAVGQWMANKKRSNPKNPLGWSGVAQAFDDDSGIHVEVKVSKSSSTPSTVNQLSQVPLLSGIY